MWPKNGCPPGMIDPWGDCFTCPYLDCIEGQHMKGAKKAKRMKVLLRLQQGAGVPEIAAEMEMSRRTVYRIKRVSNASY